LELKLGVKVAKQAAWKIRPILLLLGGPGLKIGGSLQPVLQKGIEQGAGADG
jgi:hypothetical protein